MNEQMPRPGEENYIQDKDLAHDMAVLEDLSRTAEQREDQEAFDEATGTLASAYHEDWRKTRLQEDGSYSPRIKTTTDQAWVEAHGTNEVDIANTTYAELPEDWQAENKAAAEVVVSIFEQNGGTLDVGDKETRSEVGEIIHQAWLNRNEWARGGELDVPFDQLPPDEQAKDVRQAEIASDLF